ncbi:MAG: MarC family protein [Candidatus Nanopelagicus sp.]|jgi:multiple antibiotic resistance protein|nr:MarC family protein [Candidatus Nanopelagicus sp.]
MNDVTTLTALTFGAQAFVTLFVILDPPGAAPIFLGLASGKTVKEQRKLAWQAAAVSLFVIVSFALFGNAILGYLNISLAALQGAGGILLLITGLGLLTGSLTESNSAASKNIALVPLGTPLLAGPGAIVTTMLYVQKSEGNDQLAALAIAIFAVHFLIGLTFMFSTKILSVIKDSGVELLARIAGLLLSAIAVEMIISSIKAFFNI